MLQWAMGFTPPSPSPHSFSEGSHRYLLNLKSNFLIHPIPASKKTGLPKSDGHVAVTKEINNDLTTFFHVGSCRTSLARHRAKSK